jgi:hypothetical protein
MFLTNTNVGVDATLKLSAISKPSGVHQLTFSISYQSFINSSIIDDIPLHGAHHGV